MFKKTISFEDFNGNQKKHDFYFHISKAELLEMASAGDAMQKRLQRIIAAKDGSAILQEFRDLIKLSVGVRSEDGQRFIKDAEAQSTLFDSPAFDELLMELATDAHASAEFVKQLIPEKMQKAMLDKLQESQGAPDPFADKEDDRPAYQREHRHPTDSELHEMSKKEMAEAMSWLQKRDVR